MYTAINKKSTMLLAIIVVAVMAMTCIAGLSMISDDSDAEAGGTVKLSDLSYGCTVTATNLGSSTLTTTPSTVTDNSKGVNLTVTVTSTNVIHTVAYNVTKSGTTSDWIYLTESGGKYPISVSDCASGSEVVVKVECPKPISGMLTEKEVEYKNEKLIIPSGSVLNVPANSTLTLNNSDLIVCGELNITGSGKTTYQWNEDGNKVMPEKILEKDGIVVKGNSKILVSGVDSRVYHLVYADDVTIIQNTISTTNLPAGEYISLKIENVLAESKGGLNKPSFKMFGSESDGTKHNDLTSGTMTIGGNIEIISDDGGDTFGKDLRLTVSNGSLTISSGNVYVNGIVSLGSDTSVTTGIFETKLGDGATIYADSGCIIDTLLSIGTASMNLDGLETSSNMRVTATAATTSSSNCLTFYGSFVKASDDIGTLTLLGTIVIDGTVTMGEDTKSVLSSCALTVTSKGLLTAVKGTTGSDAIVETDNTTALSVAGKVLVDGNRMLALKTFEVTGELVTHNPIYVSEKCVAAMYMIADSRNIYTYTSLNTALKNAPIEGSSNVALLGDMVISGGNSMVVPDGVSLTGKYTVTISGKASFTVSSGGRCTAYINSDTSYVKDGTTVYCGVFFALNNAPAGSTITYKGFNDIMISENGYSVKNGVDLVLNKKLTINEDKVFNVYGTLTMTNTTLAIDGILSISNAGAVSISRGIMTLGSDSVLTVTEGDLSLPSSKTQATKGCVINAAEYIEKNGTVHYASLKRALTDSDADEVHVHGELTTGAVTVPAGTVLYLGSSKVSGSITVTGGTNRGSIDLETATMTGSIILEAGANVISASGNRFVMNGTVSSGTNIVDFKPSTTANAAVVDGICMYAIGATDDYPAGLSLQTGKLTSGSLMTDGVVYITATFTVDGTVSPVFHVKSGSLIVSTAATFAIGTDSKGVLKVGAPDSTLSGSANVKGQVDVSTGTVSVYSGGNISGAVFGDLKNTELNILYNGITILYSTQYGKTTTPMDLSKPNIKNMEFADWKDVDGNKVTSAKIGQYNALYTEASVSKYDVTLTKVEGLKYRIDGDVMVGDSNGKVSLTAGEHTLAYEAENGYDVSHVKTEVSTNLKFDSGKLTVSGTGVVTPSGVTEKNVVITTESVLIIIAVLMVLMFTIMLFVVRRYMSEMARSRNHHRR